MEENQIYPAGFDFVWIGRDEKGRLAAFVTAGGGQIPKSLLGKSGEMLCDIERAILDLPKVSGVKLHVEVPRPDDFIAMAERGFFVFDWRDVHRATKEESGCYELVATPLQPATFAEAAAEKIIQNVPLSDFDLGAVTKIRLRNVDGFIGPYPE